VQVDLVGEAGVAAGVGGGQVVDDDRRAVGQDDALPDDSGSGFGTSTILTEGFGSASRTASLNGIPSRIGISGTLTVVAQAATVRAIAVSQPRTRERLTWLLPSSWSRPATS
jgi:hypothetical protein